jgi:hypothetical protein
MRATHDIGAVGKSHYAGPGNTGTLTKAAWLYAKDFVNSKLVNAVDPATVLGSGVFNNGTSFNNYNHLRVQRIDEPNGAFNVTETFILIDNTDSAVIEDFQAEIKTSAIDPFSTVTINGTIQGLESRTYGINPGDFNITTTKFANASGYYESIKDTALILPRAQSLIIDPTITLNTIPLTKVVGRSPTKGIVTYSYEYNTRPSNCIVGAKVESITINDENPGDVFSRIMVMGRSQGPILQSFSTVTEFKRNVNVEAIMIPSGGCTLANLTGGLNPNGQVQAILCILETDLRNRYNKVYKEHDSTSWDPRNGKYSRSVLWSAVDCTTAPVTITC